MTTTKTKATKDAATINPVRRVKLLSRIAGYYHKNFVDNPEGLRYLMKERGLRDVSLVKQFQIGLASGSLIDVLQSNEETRAELASLGVLTKSHHEYLNGCVVFPLWDTDGTVVNLYGRRMIDGDVNHLYLPGGKPGLWNIPAIKRSPSIIVTRSILDALTALDFGLPEAVPCHPTDGFSDAHLQFIKQCGVKRVVLAFKAGADESALADKLSAVLKSHGIAVATVALPDNHDISSYLSGPNVEDARKVFHAKVGEAFTSASKGQDIAPSNVAVPGEVYEHTEYGFKLALRDRCYEVLGITRETTQLKVVIKATGERRKGFELTTLDLFSARSRERYIRECMALYAEGESVIKADLNRVLECVEAWQPKRIDVPIVRPASAEETARATEFLMNPNLFQEILADLQTLGVAGEESNKLLCYLAVVSRKLDDPLSLLIQSRSAAGKSTLQHAVLSLTPEEDQVHYTRLTSQALFYQEEMHLAHKVVALEEAEGLGAAAYSLRALQSAKKLSVATTTKDPISGKMKTERYQVHGPVAVLLTTTSASLDEETASRFLTLTIDESREMTETILATQRHRDTLEGYLGELEKSAVFTKHQTAQRLLEPLVVINPYAEQLTFPVNSLRARRDNKKYLMLMKAVAFLHQKQRAVKESQGGNKVFRYIEVTKDDIRLANKLAVHVLGHSVDEISAPARNLLRQIHSMVKAHCTSHGTAAADYKFTRKHIRAQTGWTDFQVRTHIKELEELEYLKVRAGAWGKEYVYELAWDGNNDVGITFATALVDPDTLTEAA